MSLSVSRLVRVAINLSPIGAAVRSFSVLLIMGDSSVINGLDRYRTYNSIEDVATDFGTSAPEYLAAVLYFGQSPKPLTLMIGRWLRTASAGMNIGGILSASEQLISNWTVITTGTLTLPIDGVSRAVTGLDFSLQTNMNGVAGVLNTAFASWATVTWNGSSFVFTSVTTGIASAVGYSTAGTIAAQLKVQSGNSLQLVPGYAAETPLAAVAAMANLSTAWYGLMFAAATMPTSDQSIAVSGFIEALDISRLYGVTTQDANTLSAASTTDLAYLQKDAGYLRSFIQYSSTSKYAIASFFGRAFTVNFSGQNTTINMMYKQEPGVSGEDLTATQAGVLEDKRCNVFVKYVNDTTILQYGVMSGSAYFDEMFGLDWLQNDVQTACFNLLYQSSTKIPQTDAGSNQFVNVISGRLDQAVTNGLVAPGVWNSTAEFGELETGDYLKTGYYVFVQPMALQSQADREQRICPPIQVAAKLAGAINTLDVTIDVNR